MCQLSTFSHHLFFFDIFVIDSTANIPRSTTRHIPCQSLPAMPIPSSPQENCCPYIKLNLACHRRLDMLVGVPEDSNHATPKQIPPSPPSDSPPSSLGHATSPTDNQGYPSFPTPILKSGRNSLDAIGSPSSHASDTSSLQLPPSPTLSAHSTGLIRFAIIA